MGYESSARQAYKWVTYTHSCVHSVESYPNNLCKWSIICMKDNIPIWEEKKRGWQYGTIRTKYKRKSYLLGQANFEIRNETNCKKSVSDGMCLFKSGLNWNNLHLTVHNMWYQLAVNVKCRSEGALCKLCHFTTYFNPNSGEKVCWSDLLRLPTLWNCPCFIQIVNSLLLFPMHTHTHTHTRAHACVHPKTNRDNIPHKIYCCFHFYPSVTTQD